MIELKDYLSENGIKYFYDNLELLKEDNYSEFYADCPGKNNFTNLFFACGINPLEYVNRVPNWFASGSDIESIEIPEGIEEIGENAFGNCTSLKTVKLPSSLEILDYHSFYNCKKLKTIELPNSLEKIGEAAFKDCRSLEEIEIPNSVKFIGDDAFIYCKSLRKVRILSKDVKLSTRWHFPFNYCPEDMLVEVRTRELVDVFKEEGFKNVKLIP